MANLSTLKDELTLDPAGLGYVGKTDAQAAALIETPSRQIDKLNMTAAELHGCIDLTEYNALSATVKAGVNVILGLSGPISTVTGSQSRAWLVAAFAPGTATRTSLVAAVVQTVSRSVELYGKDLYGTFGLDPVVAVHNARALP